MNRPVEPQEVVSAPPEWLRKRDGEIVRFDFEKLRRSLELAAQDTDLPPATETLSEVARMTLFFLSTAEPDGAMSSDEVAEVVVRSLRQTGQRALADAYEAYRVRKAHAYQSLVVRSQRDSDKHAPSHWNKSLVIQSLRDRVKLDARRSREVAGRVERVVLAGRFQTISTDLVREIINNELDRLGVGERLGSSQLVHISRTALMAQLTEAVSPDVANRRVSASIWRDFSLGEIISADVAEAVHRGLLELAGLESPAQLGAQCIDCATLVRCQNANDAIAQFGDRLARASRSTFGLVALDGIETWLALGLEAEEGPGALADRFWQELRSRLRSAAAVCVLNLRGGLTREADDVMGAGPLFRERPAARQRELAAAICQEIMGHLARDRASWPTLRLDWHWPRRPDPFGRALSHRIVRMLADGARVSIVFDRSVGTLGDGLRRVGDRVRPVLDYARLSVPILWRDAGAPRSLAAIEEGVSRALQLAVRGAVQRREFLRRLPHAQADLVDQSSLAIGIAGLDWTIRQVTGRSFAEDAGSLALAETLVRHIRTAGEREGRFFALPVVLDHLEDSPGSSRRSANDGERVLGTAASLDGVGLRRSMHAAGQLHRFTELGTLVSNESIDYQPDYERLTDAIDWASDHTHLVRLRLEPPRRDAQGLVLWPEAQP